MFWLKNREPDQWHGHEAGGGDWPWTDRANFFDEVFNKVEALRSAG